MNKKTPATTEAMTSATHSAIVPDQHQGDKLALVIRNETARIDTRVLAAHLKKKRHQDVFELVKRYEGRLLELGKLLFQTGASADSRTGQTERFALLTEDQAFFVLTLSRNTPTVVDLKVKLVKAFGEARRAAQVNGAEYLPTYHALHDAVHELAAGSSNERFIHMNVNRLINKAAGIEAGQRARADLPQQAMLTVAQAVAAQAMGRAPDHQTGYQQAKAALVSLSRLTMLEGAAA